MKPTQEQAKQYAESVLNAINTDPHSLSEHEYRLVRKYKETLENGKKLTQRCESLQNQIKQAQEEFRQTELQLVNEQGRSTGFMEYLLELKFDPGLHAMKEVQHEAVPPVAVVS